MKELILRDTERIASTLKTMERNLEILNRNHDEIKYLGFPTIITLLGSDYNRYENELKSKIRENTNDCTEEKLRNLFDIVVGNLEQFETGGAWIINWIQFNEQTNTFQLKQDYIKEINDTYTFICREENLRENLAKANILIELNKQEK
jgi:hypothetical protein